MKAREDLKNYISMPKDKLESEVSVLENKITNIKLKVAAGKADDYSEVGKLKKNLARVKTILNGLTK